MTANDIIKFLSDNEITPASLDESQWYWDIDTLSREEFEEKLGEWALVHDEGGGEGGGEHVERVWHFKTHDVYLRATASYYSYHGIDYWSDFCEVTPRQKTITVYDAK